MRLFLVVWLSFFNILLVVLLQNLPLKYPPLCAEYQGQKRYWIIKMSGKLSLCKVILFTKMMLSTYTSEWAIRKNLMEFINAINKKINKYQTRLTFIEWLWQYDYDNMIMTYSYKMIITIWLENFMSHCGFCFLVEFHKLLKSS